MMVFDSSTLILLAKIDILELFISDFHGRILIPEKVMLEVSAGGGEERHLIYRYKGKVYQSFKKWTFAQCEKY